MPPPPFLAVLLPASPIDDFERIAPAAGLNANASNPQDRTVAAGEGASAPLLLNRRHYENYVRAPVEFFASPMRWSVDDWGIAALVTGGFVGLLFADKPLRDFWQRDVRGQTTDDIASASVHLGQPSAVVPAMAAALFAGVIAGDRREQAATMEAFQSLVLSLGLMEGIKLISHRQRPNESPDNALRFDGPSTHGDHKSFPSGHVAGAFALASSFALNYPDDDFVAPVGYTLAGMVALSRINDDKHWTTDVLLSAGLAYGMSVIIHRLNGFGDRSGPVTAAPYFDGATRGLQITLRF